MLRPTHLLILLILISLLLVGLRAFFRKILFNPRRQHIQQPDRPHADIMLNDHIHLWHFHDFAGRPLIVYCHGTFGNISYYRLLIELTRRLQINLLLFDYQGYGYSKGEPSRRLVLADAHAVYGYSIIHHAPNDIIVWGESLGGYPAIDIAATYPVRSLVVMSSFANLKLIPQSGNHIWLVRILAYSIPLIKLEIPNHEAIKAVKCPVVIMHSREDEFIGFDHAELLFNNISHVMKLLIPVGGTHRHPRISETDMVQLLTHCGVTVKGECGDILQQISEIPEQRED